MVIKMIRVIKMMAVMIKTMAIGRRRVEVETGSHRSHLYRLRMPTIRGSYWWGGRRNTTYRCDAMSTVSREGWGCAGTGMNLVQLTENPLISNKWLLVSARDIVHTICQDIIVMGNNYNVRLKTVPQRHLWKIWAVVLSPLQTLFAHSVCANLVLSTMLSLSMCICVHLPQLLLTSASVKRWQALILRPQLHQHHHHLMDSGNH